MYHWLPLFGKCWVGGGHTWTSGKTQVPISPNGVYECNLLAAETHDPPQLADSGAFKPRVADWTILFTPPTTCRHLFLTSLSWEWWMRKETLHSRLARDSTCQFERALRTLSLSEAMWIKNTFEGPQFQTNTCLKDRLFWTKKAAVELAWVAAIAFGQFLPAFGNLHSRDNGGPTCTASCAYSQQNAEIMISPF